MSDRRRSYDAKCAELAEHFLLDTCGQGDQEATRALAQVIQEKIEEWLEFDLRNMGCAQ